MNLDEFEELIGETLSSNFTITTDKKGQVIIHTGLLLEEDGELSDIEDEVEEDSIDFNGEDDLESYDEEDDED